MTTIISIYGHVVIGNLQHQFPKLTYIASTVMKAALAMMFPVSLLGMRGQCYSVVTLVIIVWPAGA